MCSQSSIPKSSGSVLFGPRQNPLRSSTVSPDPTLGISILKTSPLDRSGHMCGGYLAVCQERTRLMLFGLIRTWLFALTVQILDFVNKQDWIWSVSRFTLTKLTATCAHDQPATHLFTVRKGLEHFHHSSALGRPITIRSLLPG